ncbi:MAG: RagB/SusD family nutrient uptake outer membrane protein [Dysgonamonadaceae bacterium]|jgi:hypothetical protein|nr:RagB/SusD family nutrient uptake outer membrane protein [Dysgonamonadaceae bacterium]
MKKFIYNISIALTGIIFFSCNDFLDKVPDNRAEINTPEQISMLLINGYPDQNYSLIAELSGDNLIDNTSPSDEYGTRYNLATYGRADDEAFAWESIVSNTQQDSPLAFWEGSYHGIAVANHALKRIEELEAEGRGNELLGQKGEALLLRAFNHFNLINIFAKAYRNDSLSKQDPGVPYVTKVGNTVISSEPRNSVTEVYKLIEKDLLDGLALIDNAKYAVTNYHFNKRAACAFAARFYLFKRDYPKVIKYATDAIGDAPASYMRNWKVELPTYESVVNWIIDPMSPNNFLLIATHSLTMRHYTGSRRYTCNREAAKATIFNPEPFIAGYRFHLCYVSKLFINGGGSEGIDYGIYFPKAGESFEFTNKVAGIGYPHVVRTEFTGEETLLCRAEAYIHQKDYTSAFADLNTWKLSRENLPVSYNFNKLTDSLICSYYMKARYGIIKPLNMEKIDPNWKLTGDSTEIAKQTAYLQCVLHFRRIETIFDGFRWFDIKRYGIEITHKIGLSRVETLTWDDPRRALQIPSEIISAGMEPNNRVPSPTSAQDPPIQMKASMILNTSKNN